MMMNKTRLLSKNRLGFGAFVMHESNGPLTFFSAKFTYAYFLPLSSYNLSELSFGISLELSQYNINENELIPLDEGDPELAGISNSYFFPESGFGVYYHNEQFQIGFSVNELFQTKLPYNDTKTTDNSRDLFFQSGYKFYLKRFELEPMIFAAKINNRPLYFYNQVKLYYQNYNWVAVAYKSTNSITTSVGFRLRRVFFAYAYECNISRLQKYFGGSHEIMLGLNIGLFEPGGIKKTVKVKK
jgi:type IX secretion system PorP/SprF family membrane protein